MSAPPMIVTPDADLAAELRRLPDADAAIDDQARRWAAGELVAAEAYLAARPDLADPVRLILNEYRLRRQLGDAPPADEYRDRFPEHAGAVGRQIWFEEEFGDASTAPPGTQDSYPSADDETSTRPGPPGVKPATPEAPGGLRLLGKLGEGGMGVVFEAEDAGLNRRVAVKRLKPALAADALSRERFIREARAMAAVEHERIVPVHQVGEHDGTPFLVMPLLKGETLRDRLGRDGALGPAESMRVGREIAEGLAAAHAAGLIHRDVKPGNVWLKPDEGGVGRVVLLDFGLARAERVDDDAPRTEAGVMVGTAGYMSPEQARGGDIDARSDLFSLGCVLHQMATGDRPFPGNDIYSIIEKLTSHTPPRADAVRPDVPAGLAALIGRLLSKRIAGRPASAAAVVAELRQLQAGEEPARRLAWWAFPAAALFALVGVIAVSGPAVRPEPAGETVPAARVPLKGEIDVRVWEREDERPAGPGRRLHEGVLPLQAGDFVQMRVMLNRPAYMYVVWLTSDGKAYPVYPWRGYDWGSRGPERPRELLLIPPDPGRAAPLEESPSGVETLVMLARDEPLPAGADVAALFAGVPAQGRLIDPLARAWLENGELPRERHRGPVALGEAADVDDPLSRLRRLLTDRAVTDLFPYTRSVSYAFRAEGDS